MVEQTIQPVAQTPPAVPVQPAVVQPTGNPMVTPAKPVAQTPPAVPVQPVTKPATTPVGQTGEKAPGKKSKWWIWLIVALALGLIGFGIWFFAFG